MSVCHIKESRGGSPGKGAMCWYYISHRGGFVGDLLSDREGMLTCTDWTGESSIRQEFTQIQVGGDEWDLVNVQIHFHCSASYLLL